MEKINLPLFYQLGARLNPLTKFDVNASNRVNIFLACINTQTDTERLLDTFSSLTVCRSAGQKLIDATQSVREWMRTTPVEKWEEEDRHADTKFSDAVSKAKEFETVLSAELQTLATYHATQKGIYSTPDLIDRAENIFPESVLAKIRAEIRGEIRQSGMCLAFDCATASAFHIMRATEMVMHEYYPAVCKPENKDKLENWGAYIAELKKSQSPEVKEVVALLQQIKDQHRNLIMHPEIVLAPDEAFTLFEIAQASIIAMASKLRKPKEK